MITLDDYLVDQLHDPDFRTHFINEMAKHVRDGSISLTNAILSGIFYHGIYIKLPQICGNLFKNHDFMPYN